MTAHRRCRVKTTSKRHMHADGEAATAAAVAIELGPKLPASGDRQLALTRSLSRFRLLCATHHCVPGFVIANERIVTMYILLAHDALHGCGVAVHLQVSLSITVMANTRGALFENTSFMFYSCCVSVSMFLWVHAKCSLLYSCVWMGGWWDGWYFTIFMFCFY